MGVAVDVAVGVGVGVAVGVGVGVTATVNTPGEISVIAPKLIGEVPALPKSAAETVVSSMFSLKLTV